MAKMKQRTGRVSVYVMHSEGFDGRLRPSHDSAPSCDGTMTDREAGQLRTIISRYVRKCTERHAAKA